MAADKSSQAGEKSLSHSSDSTPPAVSPGTLRGQKSLFRIPLYQSSGAGASEDVGKVYHARRAHRKSRTGCVKCKQRRVKVSAHHLYSPCYSMRNAGLKHHSAMKLNRTACGARSMRLTAVMRPVKLSLHVARVSSPTLSRKSQA
jgi:hypothetical protein